MPETNFFWDPLSDNILQERDETGAVTAEYTTEPDLYGNLISQNRQGTESQYHFDVVGSTLALTDDDQQVTDTEAYTAFGEVTEHTDSTVNPSQYIGQKGYYRDSMTQEQFVRTRPSQPTLGRWLSVDPRFDKRVDVLSDAGLISTRLEATRANPPHYAWALEHQYTYVRNCPVRYSDPSGMELPPSGGYPGPRTTEEFCACWENNEKQWDKGWLTKIPACPCSLGKPPRNPDPEKWYDPAAADKAHHPGAEWCIRSRPVPYFPGPVWLVCQPGQQCCYDALGSLITHGRGAGTPDRSAPVGILCVGSHYLDDVVPFYHCPLGTYVKYRPPDNRNMCPANP